jgi:hypothetical protein
MVQQFGRATDHVSEVMLVKHVLNNYATCLQKSGIVFSLTKMGDKLKKNTVSEQVHSA